MKAEIGVRSRSVSLSACTARMAPRMISTVTGSQAACAVWRGAASSVERSIGRILDEKQRDAADGRGGDHIERRRDRAAGRADQEGRDEGREAAKDRHGEAIADRERGE